MELEEGDLVLCTVDRIVGTTVFVKIDENGEGTINFSEIAPGRIRNIRDYVVPKKKIVCKVLKITSDSPILSFRRVTQKETKEVLEKNNQEKTSKNILKSILGEKSEEVIQEILKETKLSDFLEEAKKDSKKLEKLLGKEANKVLEILKKQKKKKVVLKKDVKLISNDSNGLEKIKLILEKIPSDIEVKYISAGKYSLQTESEDLKKADNKLMETIKKIEEKSKKEKMEFFVKEK